MMKKLLILGCIMLFVFCAPKKTTVKTEGLEEVVVFGEEGQNVSEEPVYPTPALESIPTTPPPPAPEVSAPAPMVPEEPIAPPTEEVTIAPPTPQPVAPLPMEEVTAPPIPAPAPEPSYTPTPKPSAPPSSVYGFRVQIFASSTQKGANKVAEDARNLFGGKVYIEHTPPYYKVRVGDCLTKEEAEALKNLAISKGYRGAFVVETMINP